MPPHFQGRLIPGNKIRIRVKRESRDRGYNPCPDNSVALFVQHTEVNGREFAEVRLMSKAKLRISYDHIVEIVKIEYEIRRGELIDILSSESEDDVRTAFASLLNDDQ